MGSEHTSVIKLAMAKASALGMRVFQNVVGNGWTGKMESSWNDAKAGRCVEISGANFQPFGLLVPSQDRITKNAKGEKEKKKFGGGLDLVGWQTVRIMREDVPSEGLRVALFIAIDAKTQGYSTMSADQRHFAASVVKAGGRAMVARRTGEGEAVEFVDVKLGEGGMNMEHTKEPWITGDAYMIMTNIFSDGLRVARCDFDGDHENPEAQANARRIVSCVNFCQGLSTENMENDTLESSLKEVLERMKTQRDELLAALKDIHGTMIDGMTRYKWEEAFKIADAVILKTEAAR